MALKGIDVASYQASLNLSQVDYDFVVIKATQGTKYVNPHCDAHFQQAKAAGKKIGVYHYADGGDAVVEANWFVDNCKGYIRQAIFVLDWEGEGVQFTTWALKFLQHVESRIGYKPAIYMSEWVVNNHDWSAVAAGSYGLWVAKYSDYEIDNNYDMSRAGKMPVVKWWNFYFMWQWTSKGHINGYAGDLDCNTAYLTPGQWDAYAGTLAPSPAPPAPNTETPPAAPVVVASPAVDSLSAPNIPVPEPVETATYADTHIVTEDLDPIDSWATILQRHNKTLMALSGVAVQFATLLLGVNSPYVTILVALFTAFGVYRVANK